MLICPKCLAQKCLIIIDYGNYNENNLNNDKFRLLSGPAPPPIDYNVAICCICQSDKPTIVFDPCGHLCMCYKCTKESETKLKDCPICRVKISKTIKVYAS